MMGRVIDVALMIVMTCAVIVGVHIMVADYRAKEYRAVDHTCFLYVSTGNCVGIKDIDCGVEDAR